MKLWKVILTASTAVAFVACSSSPKVQDFPASASAAEEVRLLDQELKVAADNNVDVLSPDNFEEAKDHNAKAKKILSKQGSRKDALHHVAKGRAYLRRSNEFAILAQSNLDEVIQARQQAIMAGAGKYFKRDFESAEDQLVDITQDIEDNDLDSALKNKSKLQLIYLDLELRSIKQASLREPRATIASSLKEGGKEFAPRTLAVAMKSVQDTDSYITANRHDVEGIRMRSMDAQTKAEHLLKITRESRIGKRSSPEEIALQMESEKNMVRDQRGELARGETANRALWVTNEGLASKEMLNKRYEEARREFTSNEAEVYKQGDSLLIRLKGLKFPSAGSELTGSNYPLMVKVQKVIKNFGAGSVLVQGHTDSLGNKASNQKLSEDRAESVKDYLANNSDDQDISIESQGMGYQRPIASNKTASGRASNRRVDLVIRPDLEDGSNTISK